jgi:hydroxyethylthiazole kinase-like uncharacterized protein yjeF
LINVIRAVGVIALEYLTPEEMRRAELRASSRGLDVAALMENAGAAVARTIRERYASGGGHTILVVCGTGNNGGDGFVVARGLSKEWEVRVLLLATSPSMIKTIEAKANFERLAGERVTVALAGDADAVVGRKRWFTEAEIALDGIFGTGVKGEVREPMRTAIRLINESEAVKVAIDVPSGLDPASGAVGAGATVRADLTIALHRAKTGLRGAEEFTGEVVVVPIGISDV